MRSQTKHLVTVLSLALFAASSAPAQLITITDTTPGASTRDGTLNPGEYGGLTYYSSGIGSGFGNVLGSNSQIFFDASLGGALNVGFQLGANLNDAGVIYIDSIGGGLTGTTTIEDTGDSGRSAISGDGGGNESELTFAAGFTADYAITLENNFSGLFRIENDGSLTFVTSLNLTPTGDASQQQREGELLLSDIGVSHGGSFNYVATYLNSGNAFRSDELHGHSTALGGNIGQNPFTFDNYNTFITPVPEPTSVALLGLGVTSLLIFSRRKA